MSITIPFSLQTIPETEAIKEEMRVNGGKKQPFDVSWEIHNQLLQKLRPLEAGEWRIEMDVVELICDMEKQKRDFGQEMTPEELENISKIATARLKQIMDLDVRRNGGFIRKFDQLIILAQKTLQLSGILEGRNTEDILPEEIAAIFNFTPEELERAKRIIQMNESMAYQRKQKYHSRHRKLAA